MTRRRSGSINREALLMSTVASLGVEMDFNGKKFDQGINQQKRKLGGLGKILGNAFSTGLGFVGAQAFSSGLDGIKDSVFGAIGAASDMNETLSKTRAIFGDSAGVITDWA